MTEICCVEFRITVVVDLCTYWTMEDGVIVAITTALQSCRSRSHENSSKATLGS